ncbi:MAG: ketol-acid reductoisomerase [Xanthomonadales bacterium]|nr:ketol-acid reductoisomerase [Xanthomonadales bacterium]NIN59949.1 ketol-acid reductoisomerase [Xanthomonadales bacterium]NIN75323.1 ketol-acid reductoisomerase [Xanthomonadales bacterium]NIO13491.1 ketol-acid reductoisomerase [Xanthomonadales bacterium]NIP12342.1 ketol-acid reductoisomerase [Xanthomonadales bacterium]
MKLFTEADVKRDALQGRTVAVLGYGSQGRAHAKNLRDSGYRVIVGARSGGPSAQAAAADGFEVAEFTAAAGRAQVICMLVPDMAQPRVYEQIRTQLNAGDALLFAHGFNIHFGAIEPAPEIDVIMVAPKSPGDLVRRQYEQGRGVPCLRAVFQDASGEAAERALSYAHAIGGTRAGVLDTTFAEETETDLFGEQAVLCGGTSQLVLHGYETLVEAGYQPEAAYFECLHELKLIVDLLYEGGLEKMYEFISDTASYGDLVSGPRIIDEGVKQRMQEVLGEIQDGSFARRWMDEYQAGSGDYRERLRTRLAHPIESVGRRLRERMSWLTRRRRAQQAA